MKNQRSVILSAIPTEQAAWTAIIGPESGSVNPDYKPAHSYSVHPVFLDSDGPELRLGGASLRPEFSIFRGFQVLTQVARV
jgi:hypothetical protein